MLIISNIIGCSQQTSGTPSVVTDFITRVEADDGIVEAKQCLIKAVLELGWKEFIKIVTDFETRVTNDVGSIFSKQCLENAIFTLKAN